VIYIAIAALIINLAVSVVLTLVFRAAQLPAGTDETIAADYSADPGEAPIAAVPAPAATGNGSGRHRAQRQPTSP
jgi:SSS family solute:Na+ symporter